jgi:predicted dehydrogenase
VESLWSFNEHLSPLEVDVEDIAEIGLKFSSGAIGGVHVNYVQRPPVHRLEIVGTNGTLRWDNADGVLHLQTMPAPFGSYSAQPPAPISESFSPPEGFERNQLFMAQTKHFIDVTRGEAQPICDLTDGIRVLQMALAAYESQKTEKLVRLIGKK